MTQWNAQYSTPTRDGNGFARRCWPGQRICPECAEPGGMLLRDEAASVCDVSEREILRWLAERAIHFRVTAEGFVFICLRSLLTNAGRDDLLTTTKGEPS